MTNGPHDPATAGRTTQGDGAKKARTIAGAVGAVFLLVGILGFVPGVTSNVGDMTFADHHSDAMLLGIFQVSILHNIVHLLFGVVGLAAFRSTGLVVPYLFGSAAIYLLLTVYGVVIDQESAANFVPVNNADNWLHIALAAGMAVLGFVAKKLIDGDRGTATTRR